MNIAVTQLVYFRKERDQMVDCLDQRLSCFLQKLGHLIYPIPNSFVEDKLLERWLENAKIDAIILSGGGNVGEAAGRDQVERVLIEHAIHRGIPLIGICRGMQAIILHFGGSVVAKTGHVKNRHDLVVNGKQVTVNSFHDFCVDDCTTEFTALAFAEDGTVESVCHKEHQILGIMWHPEREDPFQTHDLNLFSSFMGGQRL